jgi:N-acylneuraminate cytidylyltransferase/CMP-N,N'-diacetyllegionaminic acid synthase
VDEVAVSTDNDEIAALSRAAGASVPFKRPAKLATDRSSSMDVVLHAMKHFEERGIEFDILVLLQPTSPLRKTRHLDAALELFNRKKARAVLSVTEAEHSPAWMNRLPADLCMKNFVQLSDREKNRQALGKYYRLNGAIYIADWDFLKKSWDWFSSKTFAYVMDRLSSTDIDTLEDFQFAEYLRSGASALRCE